MVGLWFDSVGLISVGVQEEAQRAKQLCKELQKARASDNGHRWVANLQSPLLLSQPLPPAPPTCLYPRFCTACPRSVQHSRVRLACIPLPASPSPHPPAQRPASPCNFRHN